MKLVSIILPTYNEAGNIIPLITEIKAVVKQHLLEIIVVDDNSPDGTSEQVLQYKTKSKENNVRLITRYENRGLTNSLKCGIRRAKGDVVVWMDCDFSHPPKLINKLLDKIEKGFDIAVASRFINPFGKLRINAEQGRSIKGGGFKGSKEENPLAILLSRLMNYSIQFMLGGEFKDYTSGFIAARKKVFKKIKLRGDYGEYFIDLIYKALAHKFKIVEIPFVNLPRKSGESKTGSNLYEYIMRGRKYIALSFQLLVEKHILGKIP